MYLSLTDPQLLDRFKYEMSYGVDRFFLLSYCLACCWPGFTAVSNLRVVRQWNELEFNFPSPLAEQTARGNRHYVPGYSVPIDVEVHHRNGSYDILSCLVIVISLLPSAEILSRYHTGFSIRSTFIYIDRRGLVGSACALKSGSFEFNFQFQLISI